MVVEVSLFAIMKELLSLRGEDELTSVRKLFTRRLPRFIRKVRRKIRYYIRYGFRDAFTDQQKLLSELEISTVFDVGANQGTTVEKYRRLFPKADIYAFEPTPSVCSRLKERFQSDFRVKPVQLAVGGSEQEVILFVNDSLADMNSMLRPSSRSWVTDVYEVAVEMTSLDSFCALNNISEIDLLKLDIQGSEVAALQGASALLSNGKIACIYLECQIMPLYEGQPLLGDIFAELHKYGYSLFNFYNFNESKVGQGEWCDAIFISPQMQALVDAKNAGR